MKPSRAAPPAPRVTIREAVPADHEAIVRLAALDSARVPRGRVLVAEIAGEIVAATPVDGGVAVADPFRPTADVVRLLTVRAEQLRAREATRRRWIARFALRPAFLGRAR